MSKQYSYLRGDLHSKQLGWKSNSRSILINTKNINLSRKCCYLCFSSLPLQQSLKDRWAARS
ncbi:hypothetical protein BDQ94DRAFT_140672 [Aspergillus welwitschiae]|uniref:Uncharacterized protein n=1 Tax=Aspergillus welwitschiae TaxID=1341132 RepID=A0A3F3Q9B0_9EURO|nr:hypothetical protein BDQ94DRAFT_140672 [Aspergillus welwitschiae]RDH35326.1 hypothetical protein BDQ94DRAFT_140672 [Aspergillus welwitschiae]